MLAGKEVEGGVSGTVRLLTSSLEPAVPVAYAGSSCAIEKDGSRPMGVDLEKRKGKLKCIHCAPIRFWLARLATRHAICASISSS